MPYYGGVATNGDWRRLNVPAQSGLATVQASFSVFPLVADGGNFQHNMLANTIAMAISYNFTNTSGNPTAVWSSSYRIGVYTRTGATLSLLNSASGTWGNTAATSNASNIFNGIRLLSIASSQWSSAPYLLDGQEYHVAIQFLSAATTTALSVMQAIASALSTVGSFGLLGAATLSGTAFHPFSPFLGLFSATTTAVPGSIGQNQITGVSSNAVGMSPWMRIIQEGTFPA